ncbi:hypothetical protein TNCV_3380871 [Trichonephila clavipes]|nr:hypothetical protein TNCV_3380871 [Trichonephila clavipes]
MEDVMEIHASQSDESLLDDLPPRPSSSVAPCEEQVRRLDALFYLLELPWSKNSTMISNPHIHVPARMRCSSGDISEKYHDNARAWL